MTITTFDIDGIPAEFAESTDGVTAAGILFRVGQADETLATRGITHLVEHLALHAVAAADVHHNGTTDLALTHFFASGTPEQVVRVLNGVCAALRELPLARLSTELAVLRTEEQSRSFAYQIPIYRYGAQGYGLGSYEELGLDAITGDAVHEWVARYFTSGNAAVWVRGPAIPEGFDLRLADGPRVPAPEATNEVPTTPAWFTNTRSQSVTIDGIVERTSPAALFGQVLGRVINRDVRQRDGLSYTAGAGYNPRDRDAATITVYADCLPENAQATVCSVMDALAIARHGVLPQEILDEVRHDASTAIEHRDWVPGSLPGRAANRLLGHANLETHELLAEYAAVTTDDLRAVADEFWNSAVAQLPVGNLDWARWSAAPAWSSSTITGQEYAHRGDGAPLVVGAEGVSVGRDQAVATVLFSKVAAVHAFADGGRWFIGHDGIRVHVEPTLFEIDERLIEWLDGCTPPKVRVKLPRRDADRLPDPGPRTATESQRPGWLGRRRRQ